MAADCAAAPAVRSKSTAAVPATATATVSARTGDTARRERYNKRDRCDLQAASGSSSVHNVALAPLKRGITAG
jgi:hypothetical protein